MVPTLFVFGTMPAIPIPDSKSPKEKDRMATLKTTKEEMLRISADQKLLRDLISKLPPSTKYHVQPGDLVRVYREETKKWICPVQGVKTERKIIHVSDGVKNKAFNASQFMPITIRNLAEDEYLDVIDIRTATMCTRGKCSKHT